MRFADIFLSTHEINVSKLNLKNLILRRGVTSVEKSVSPPTSNRGGKVNLEIDID